MSGHKNKRGRDQQARQESKAKAQPNKRVNWIEKTLGIGGSVASIVQASQGSYTLPVCFLMAVVIWFLHHRWGTRKVLFGGLSFTVVIGGVSILYYLRPPPPFSVEIETALASDTGNDSAILAEYGGHLATPVPLVLFMRIVNLQAVPSTISDLKVQVELKSTWWGLRRKWFDTSLLPGDMPLLEVDSTGQFRNLELVGVHLETVLRAHPLAPHNTIRGWALFDAPSEFGIALRPLVYRIMVRDTAGRSVTTILTVPKNSGDIFRSHKLLVGPPMELKNMTVRHFFYPAPN